MIQHWLSVILACAPQVAPQTVDMLITKESHGRPFAINVNGHRLRRQPTSLQEAQAWAQWLVDRDYSVDAGLMQINSANWERLGLNAASVFDPCSNVRAGGTILTESYLRAARQYGPGQKALWAAVSAYNTGNFHDGFANGYVKGAVEIAASAPPLAPDAP